MINIGIYIIDNNQQIAADKNYSLFSNIKDLDSKNINVDILDISYEDIPKDCTHDGIMLVSKNTLFSNNFLNTCSNLINILPDFGVLCGKNSCNHNNQIEKYNEFDLNVDSAVVVDISNEEHNYPSIDGALISKAAYNNFSYRPTISHRHKSINNKSFLYSVAKKYPIYYSSKLIKLQNFDKENNAFLLDKYYDYGYQDGFLLRYKTEEEKNKELWHRFVESPESIDREMPRWFFHGNNKNYELLQTTLFIKCKYQIGFLEGLMNQSLV